MTRRIEGRRRRVGVAIAAVEMVKIGTTYTSYGGDCLDGDGSHTHHIMCVDQRIVMVLVDVRMIGEVMMVMTKKMMDTGGARARYGDGDGVVIFT